LILPNNNDTNENAVQEEVVVAETVALTSAPALPISPLGSEETLDEILATAQELPEEPAAVIRRIINSSRTDLRKTVAQPLASAVQTLSTILVALAQSWLALGAKAFTIWNDDTLLFCWPQSLWAELEKQESSSQMHWSTLNVQGQSIGKVGILGIEEMSPLVLDTRMEAETILITQLVIQSVDLKFAQGELLAQLDVIAGIQSHLLPQTFPQIAGLDIFAHCLPAAQIGGDFYSFHTARQRPFVFAVGDVSGKGLPAAFLMAMTRIALYNAARFMPGIHPSALLKRINEDLYDDFTELGMFATIFSGCYNAENRVLSYANAGHSPVIYCPSQRPATLLEADGPASGVLPINLSEDFTLTLHPGDVLVAATDGFSEATNAQGEMFGYQSLLALVEELAHLSAATIATTMYERISSFAGGTEQSDDQTLVILKGVEA
jgi:serine phosphatase RsbU (regulator of sigma subunit)